MQMLFLLFKKEITKTFKLNYLKRGNVSQRNKIMASYIAVGVAFVFFLVRWIKLIFEFRSYNWMEEEIVPFLLTPVISVSVFLALIVGFFGGSGLIFFDKNYEAEYSWPVAVEITVVSKMLVPYFVLVLVDIALIGPLITLYGAVRAISIFFVLAAAVELLLLPVVPYLLGIVLGRLVLSLLQKKSSVTIRLGSIILVMMLGAYFFIVFYFSFSGSDGSQIVQQFISFFGSFTNKYFEGIFEFVFLNTSIYILTIGRGKENYDELTLLDEELLDFYYTLERLRMMYPDFKIEYEDPLEHIQHHANSHQSSCYHCHHKKECAKDAYGCNVLHF